MLEVVTTAFVLPTLWKHFRKYFYNKHHKLYTKRYEWHRVVWTFTANNTTGSPIGGYNDNSETGDLWYLWGAQLVDGSNPLPYYRNYNGSPENADGTEHAPSIVDGAYEFDGSKSTNWSSPRNCR